MNLDLMKLFEGYVRNYHTFNLTVHHGKHSFTMTEIEYFSRLGSMLGYHPFTEDTAGGTCRPMDLSWWGKFDGEYWNDFILHLERENLFKKDEETLDKLFCDRELVPSNVIGIMNVQSGERINELIDIAKLTCKINNALLIFRTTSSGKSQPYFDEVLAYLLNNDQVVETRKAFVSEIAGTLFMQLENER
ncbi:hypothetical protein SAMN03159341_1436 [Paenibacillus sp. 1_12]|uniref:hypothetical protein n=1 Tax=Paenibacillus sp. 1_12 TaxID=1566278 RepID=UPI0008F1E04F|nr:hypothetical protein [Paenibacillus sp. 1_12]SFM52756.1 hypothetical protein SAMN03159341_1436 [Paenibacillus sp. 1_12]